MRTRVSGRWVIGYRDGQHRIIPDGEVVYEDGVVEYVGREYGQPVDRTIDMTEHLVTPGFVNLHCVANADLQLLRLDLDDGDYPTSDTFWDGSEEVLNQRLTRAGARHAMASALSSGSTTVGAITTMAIKRWEDPHYEAPTIVSAMQELGLRGYVAHQFHTGCHRRTDDETWNEACGMAGLDRAVEFAENLQQFSTERIRPFIFPYTLDSCSADLLSAAKREADRLGVHLRMHFAQSLSEVETIRNRHGTNPVRYLEDIDVLDRNVILTHGIYIAGQGGTAHPDGGDLDLLADRGVALSHEPLVMARRGIFLNSFSRYRRHGVTIGLGTDTFPQDMVSLMRWGAAAGKAVERRADTATARELFDAATLGGARALNRSDIGRLEPGAKADLVCVDFSSPHTGYVHDPIRTLVYNCYGTDVSRVVVDGKTRVLHGEPVGIQSQQLSRRAQEAFDEIRDTFVDWDDQARTAADLFPMTYPTAASDSGRET